MPIWLKVSTRLLLIVVAISLLAVGGLLVFRQVIDLHQIRSDSDALGNYVQTVGGIYAVLLAFVVVVVWGQFNDARGYVNREASAIVDVHRTASGLPAEARDVIQQGLLDYVDAVISDEWKAMTKRDTTTIERIGQRLDHVWVAIHNCDPKSECQLSVYGEVLARFNDLSELRTSRLTSAEARIPIAMNVLLYTGALIMIGSVYLMPFEILWVHGAVAGALAGAIAHILYLIYDLDSAFSGDYQVDRKPFVRARRSIEHNHHLR
jgi:hypothetical protein